MGEMVEMVERDFNLIVICDKMLLACRKADRPLQRNTKNVTLNMKNNKLNPFDLNRTEYAELLGISPNAVRMRMRHGKLEGEYIFENGRYNFRAPQRERVYIGQDHPNLTTTKRKINRGNHYKANYPNEAFRKHNEAKMLAKLKHNVDEDIQALLPDAIEIAKGRKREMLEAAPNTVSMSVKKSSFSMGGIYHMGSNRGYGSPGYMGGTFKDPNTYVVNNRGKKEEKKKYYW